MERDLYRIYTKLTKLIRLSQTEAILCENITFTQFTILDYVIETEKLELSNLHKLLQVEKSTTTRLIEPLVKKGLIKKKKSHRDTRAIELEITEQGQIVHNKVWLCVSDFLKIQLDEVSEEKRKTMFKGLNIFIDSFNDASKKSCEIE